METYTSSPSSPDARHVGAAGGLAAALDWLDAAITNLATLDPATEPDLPLATGTLAAERLADRFDAVRLRLLAAVDARGAAGAEQGVCAPTAAWLRATCRVSPGLATQRVRTARALHRGPLPVTAAALASGDISYAHAAALADATRDLPPSQVRQAEPALAEAALRLDPPRLHRVVAHLREVIDPDGTEARGRVRLEQRGLRLAATFDGMVDLRGLLGPEAGEALRSALEPLARPTGPDDQRNAAQRRADALGELGRRALQAGELPQEGGLRPNLNVTVDLASLQAEHGVGGVGGWGGVLPGEAVRRLACDAALTRAVVHRHPAHPDHGGHPGGPSRAGGLGHGHGGGPQPDGTTDGVMAERVRAAIPLLGAPVEVLELGRSTRTIKPSLRKALGLRDGGCAAEGCDRPPQWTDAHHVTHWLDGGPTSLDNLVLLCRTHHVAVHEGGWRLDRDPTSGRVTLTPPARHHYGHGPPAA